MQQAEIDTSSLSLAIQRGPPTAASGFAHLQVIKDCTRVDVVLAGDRDVTVLGRNSNMSHVRLEHPSISRRHAALVHNGDGDVFAADLDSTHGTYVNGCKIPSKSSTKLKDGDVLKFGESTRSYIFRLSAPPSAGEQSAASTVSPRHQLPVANKGRDTASVQQSKRVEQSNVAMSSSSTVHPESSGGVTGEGRRMGNTPYKSVEGETKNETPSIEPDAEQEAMLRANLPSSFGAVRDKPLGKKRDRKAEFLPGGAGAQLSADNKRFVAGRQGSGTDNIGRSTEEDAAQKVEARKRREAEIAAITAELSRADASNADDRESKGDGEENYAKNSDYFKPGAWRNSKRGVRGFSSAERASKNSIRSKNNEDSRPIDADREEEEEPLEEVEEEEQEEVTEETRVREVVRRLGLPVSHEVKLSGHAKSVTALALDRAGGRVATGSNDYKVKLFDFGGMDKRHLPFRQIEPEEGNVVVSISYSGTGHSFLVCTAGSQPKVYDRDGNELAHFVKGDPYIKDMAKTKGHVTRVTGGDWHPTKRNEMLTCSVDGTVRLWDLNGKKSFDNLICKHVVKLRSARALKLGCTTAVYHQEGKRIVAGGEDGSLHLIQLDRPHAKHDVVRDAHTGNEVTSVCFNEDGHLLASRAMDDTVKLWDIRKFGGGVVKTFSDVPTHLGTANSSFSSDGRVLVCGTNVNPKANDTGTLKFFDVYTAETAAQLEVSAAPNASVARVVWHSQTNQITCSTTAGGVRVMYDPAISNKGAMLSSSRSHGRLETNMFVPEHAVGEIFNPHALPMYRTERNPKKRKERSDRKDPVKSRKPDPPMPGRGVQGRVSSSYNFHQYVLKEHLVSQKNLLHEDPREELLKYDEDAKKDGEFLGTAYRSTQPHGAELHHRTLEEEEEEFKEEQKKLLDT